MSRTIRFGGLVGAVLVAASLWGLGCSGGKTKTTLPPVDEGHRFARKMPLDFEVNDRVDASQRGRIRWRYIEPDNTGMFTLTFKLANANVDGDLAREPARIRDFYTVKSHRIEPVGLVYLWPVGG